jgi:putative aldouronate transport system substrate-binding protein
MKTKLLVASLTAACAVTVLAGCTGKTTVGDKNTDGDESSKKITITFFDKNSGSKTFDDVIAKEIMAKTGVTIQVENPTGDPLEKLNLMLSGENYPDIVLMDRSKKIVNRYIEAGALIPLNDLIDQYGPHIKQMYGEVLNKSRYSDGKNYYLNNWYGVDPDASAGVLMRRDYLTKLVGKERAESPEPFTLSEFLNLCRLFKQKYPTIGGKNSIAVTLNAEDKNYEGTIFGMFGMKTYYQTPDGNLEYRVRDPRYRKMISFMNDLYTENLLDKEWVVNKREQWIQKLSSGNVFATFASYWDTDPANASLLTTDGDQTQFYSYKIVPDGMNPSETTYNGRSTLGWDAIGVTKNCKNPAAAMKMIDFLASEEGQYLMLWGLEGEHWTMVDGKHVPKPEIVEAFQTNFDETSLKTGIRKWIWFIKNGKGSDGTPYDMATKYKLQKTAEFANKCFGKSDSWDTADFTGLEPAESTPDGLKWQKVEDIYNQTFPKMVDAADENKSLAVYNEMIKEMDAAGLQDVEKDISASYRQRMKLWGIAD